MGKRHKRRRMVNKIAPHKGPVFLAKSISLNSLEVSPLPVTPEMRAMERHLAQMMDQLVTATLIPPRLLGMAGSTTIASLYRRKSQ